MKFSKEVSNVLRDFFIELRSKRYMSLRQYEGLLRMAEAVAEMQSHRSVAKQDAERVVNLVKEVIGI